MPFTAVNPYTEELIGQYPSLDTHGIDRALDRAERAYAAWRALEVKDRAEVMNRAAELLEGEIPVVAELMTREMGKTFAAAKGEAAKCAMTMRYYAQHAPSMLDDEVIASSASHSGVRFDPIGPILAIMPWNFPLWQVVRFAVPTLMAGNVVLVKHAPNVPGCALYLEDLFTRAGFAPGVVTNLFVEIEHVPALIGDPRVRAVTVTGSERAGRAVAELAGRHLKRCVLELGGSDAFIVGASADMERTVSHAVTARVQNNGQACIAAKRFIVVAERGDEFIDRFSQEMARVRTGDPMDPATDLGPLANSAQRDLLGAQVADALDRGARALTGGTAKKRTGYFYPATVLTNVPSDSRAAREELFGPVAVVQVARDLGQAIDIANATPWGLSGSVWATETSEIDAVIEGLEVGMVFANAIVASMPELPFGGTKNSGFGRELSLNGLREFANAKTFYVA
ncbi:MAG: NAD-dependent succinate-semialdehyde dehydrogenase [Acidimicrobiales bacterium]